LKLQKGVTWGQSRAAEELPVGQVGHGEGFTKFVENKSLVVKQEGEGGRASIHLSAKPKKRCGEVQLSPSLYFGCKVERKAALVLLRKTGTVLVQHVEVERREACGEGCENELALFSSTTFARVEVFAAGIGRCSCS
jgi:hypothetical protein